MPEEPDPSEAQSEMETTPKKVRGDIIVCCVSHSFDKEVIQSAYVCCMYVKFIYSWLKKEITSYNNTIC